MDWQTVRFSKKYHIYDVANDHIDFEFPIRFDVFILREYQMRAIQSLLDETEGK